MLRKVRRNQPDNPANEPGCVTGPMDQLSEISSAPPPERTSELLFDGALLKFPGLPGVRELVARGRRIVEEVFETSNPVVAERSLPPAVFRKRSLEARRRVAGDDAIAAAWLTVLTGIGYPPCECYLDRVRLRVVPSRRDIHGRIIRPLPPHRDSWGSGITAQINLWLPLYPIDPGRTIVIWPELFDVPVANNSATWDYDTLMRRQDKTYPLLPTAAHPVGDGFGVVIAPGELLVFAAAHLHASRAVTPDRTRFGLDTRMVWAGDIAAGRGAPNVDGRAVKPRWEWFHKPSGRAA